MISVGRVSGVLDVGPVRDLIQSGIDSTIKIDSNLRVESILQIDSTSWNRIDSQD